METIRVNMTPCEDIKTIHASQNDNEGREWGYELHNNGEKIDSSSISDQLVFKAYKGGTEEILPTNGSTPTTSPIIADIKYPQGLLTDQEFTYRESPTEEDGLAKITDIKGNTLVWNQLVPTANKDFTSTNTDTRSFLLICRQSVSPYTELLNKSNVSVGLLTAIFQSSFTGSIQIIHSGQQRNFNILMSNIVSVVSGHKYLLSMNIVGVDTSVVGGLSTKDLMIFDLTAMGLDITDPSDFTSLFPLSYYSYNQGSLLSFNGNGIKTVGFNQWDEEWEVGAYSSANGAKVNTSDRIRSKNFIHVLPSTTYYRSKGMQIYYYDANHNFISWFGATNNGTFVIPSDVHYITFNGLANSGTTYNNDICINISSSRNGEYEPYTESTLSLPISTYFTNGMNGVGTDYDELANTKATTRMTRVDLGSLDWNYNPTYGMYSTGISNSVKKPSASSVRVNAISTIGTFTDWATFYASGSTSGLCAINTSGYIGIATTETNSTTFKNSLQGVYLVYPLATPIETSFTTASLVTENAEIPLSNEDGVLIGKCTEQLSADAGFIEGKIKLSDEDGECYSNKIQLHIERSPQ